MRSTLFRPYSLLLIAAMSAHAAVAQEQQLTPEQEERVQKLSTEIEKLTNELNTLKAKAESGASDEELAEEAEKIEDAAADVISKAEDVEEDFKLWTGEIEFGYVDTSGNTEETTVKSKADISRERDAWRFNIFYDSLNAKSDGERTAEKYFYSNRLAYAYSEHNYSFVYASYDDDRFSGFDYQATVALGYGRRIYNKPDLKWDIEVGPGYRYNKYDDTSTEDDTDELIIRAYTKFEWEMTDSSTFTQVLSTEAGDENTVSKSITALKTKINGSLSLKVSYTIKYTEEVPADKKHADTETAVTLSYSF